ncbi:protein phosphatase 1H-like isoform X1 [Pollicipes pollicipes]|uniref:protein phosphatase 1H-like isoform X1 n=1 Tax=Pollicipes pollicipes TaxID=41117 RepID=UPI001884F155|nr:protein phosphatase 1H-like isoform X1 [Pollicipes pollicipes]
MFSRFRSALLSSMGGVDSAVSAAEAANQSSTRPTKFPYGRPCFLQLESEDELQVASDHIIRPIIVPRQLDWLPWMAGYAEAVNAGKSKRNEDNASVFVGSLEQRAAVGTGPAGDASASAAEPRLIPYYYFGLFDGHAGDGASVAAASQLHHIIHDRLVDVMDILLPLEPAAEAVASDLLWVPTEEMSVDRLVTGALEAAFHDMDALIAEDRLRFDMRGGCTAVVALLLLGRLYVANAGDSRAVLCRAGHAGPATTDFTPESERQRVRQLAGQQPALTGGEFTHLDFCRRVSRRDIGKRVLYRDAHMTGWAYKTVTERDLKFPIVCGDGKRSRVCATIGVTRGFGDHDLKAQNTNVLIKPFLSSQPEVLVIDLEKEAVTEYDVLVMATDGLWDVVSNGRAAQLVDQALRHYPADDPSKRRYSAVCTDRCTSAAQDLVMAARGKLKGRLWRLPDGGMATIDDISAFVVPLLPYREEHLLWKMQQQGDSVRAPPSAAPTSLRQVSEPAELARYQTLVEQCGRPAEPVFADAESGDRPSPPPPVLVNGTVTGWVGRPGSPGASAASEVTSRVAGERQETLGEKATPWVPCRKMAPGEATPSVTGEDHEETVALPVSCTSGDGPTSELCGPADSARNDAAVSDKTRPETEPR